MSSSLGGVSGSSPLPSSALLGSGSGGAFNNPQILQALLPNYNISALDQAMQTELTAAEAPLNQLSNQLSQLQAQSSSWQQLQSDLQGLQSAAKALAGSSLYNTLSASSSNQQAVTASVAPGTSGVTGTYQLAVTQLAQDEIDNSAAQSSSSAALGYSGSFSLNGKSITVASSNSLQTMAQSVNAAGAGVTATVLPTSGGGAVLNIASTEGQAITWSDPNGILAGLGVLGSGATPAHQLQAATAAQYTVNGVAETSPTNTDSTTLPGVTFQLLGTTPAGSPALITLSQDQQAVSGGVQQLASAFNTLLGDLNKFGGTGGALEGQGSLLSISQTLEQTLSTLNPGAPSGYQSLSQIGVTLSAPVSSPSDLTLQVDGSTLAQALQADPSAVQSLLSGTAGIATQLQQQLNAFVGPTGSVPGTLSSLQQQISSLGTEVTDPNSTINMELTMQQQQIEASFSSMLSALLSSQQQGSEISSFLQAQSGQQNGSSGGSSGG